jgi:hypothetical protein
MICVSVMKKFFPFATHTDPNFAVKCLWFHGGNSIHYA